MVVESVLVDRRGGTRDLSLYVQIHEGVVYGVVEYDMALFDPSTARRMADDYLAVLRAAMENPQQALDQITQLNERSVVLVGE